MYNLLPPYVSIERTTSIYGVGNTSVDTAFGYIHQVNQSTISYNVGDRVMYNTTGNHVIFYDLLYFDIVDESKIILKET